jgi:hypothetical protein
MNQAPIASAAGSSNRIEQLRDHLTRALDLMDEIKPYTVPAARLQQIIDEFDVNFASDR